MMLTAFIIELILLYLISNRLSNALYHLFMIIFRNNYVAMGILTFIYLPGTVIHEFSHLIIAEILRVKTGEISFAPKIEKLEKNQQELRMGSVQIAQTDPFRKLLIAIAPVIFGLFFLFLIISLFQNYYPQAIGNWQKIGLITLAGYFLFAISNNMFSSNADMKNVWFLPILFIVIISILYFMGLRFSVSGKILELYNNVISGLTTSLAIVLVVNTLVLSINLLILNKIFKTR